MPWGPPSIKLLIPPHHAVHLLAWGQHPTGSWWGLVTWERWMARHFESPSRVNCTAWTAAANVQQVEHEDYGRVAPVALDNDPAWWPTPPGPQLGQLRAARGHHAAGPARRLAVGGAAIQQEVSRLHR